MRLPTSLALAALTTNALALNIHRQAHRRQDNPSKRGIAYNDPILVDAVLSQGAVASWAYNWDSTDNGVSSLLEFVPMLWSDKEEHTSRWVSNVEAMIDNGSRHILSFNEPDHAAQANMSPQAAAAAHAEYLGPYAEQARIGSPGITNSVREGQGVKWLEAFMSACEAEFGCHVDFCAAHWYSDHNVQGSLMAHLEDVRRVCGDRPVWLTEFAPQGGSVGDYVSWIEWVVGPLDDLEWLERHSYFMVGEPGTLTTGGSLNAQGAAYFQTS